MKKVFIDVLLWSGLVFSAVETIIALTDIFLMNLGHETLLHRLTGLNW